MNGSLLFFLPKILRLCFREIINYSNWQYAQPAYSAFEIQSRDGFRNLFVSLKVWVLYYFCQATVRIMSVIQFYFVNIYWLKFKKSIILFYCAISRVTWWILINAPIPKPTFERCWMFDSNQNIDSNIIVTRGPVMFDCSVTVGRGIEILELEFLLSTTNYNQKEFVVYM